MRSSARHEIAEHVGADQAIHLEHEGDDHREHREEGRGVAEVGLGEAHDEAMRVQSGQHLASGAPHQEEHEHDDAAEDEIRPEAELLEEGPEAAVAREQHVAAHQERDDHPVDHALPGFPRRSLAREHVEDGGDDTGREHDGPELASPGAEAGRTHHAASIAPASRTAPPT